MAAQKPGGKELVVSGEQGRRVVQHVNAARGKSTERPQPIVDPVERRQNIEPPERAVARTKDLKCLRWGQWGPGARSDQRVRKRFVRGRGPTRDERELHPSKRGHEKRGRQGSSPTCHARETGWSHEADTGRHSSSISRMWLSAEVSRRSRSACGPLFAFWCRSGNRAHDRTYRPLT
jgi:hypothetical protein